jgi:NAD(P)H-dependent flavin oxidoreductase YrpB (nitropropane dioxygenase family)
VLAPLAGGPSTPELAAIVSEAGVIGFVAAGYLSADALGDQIRAVRAGTSFPFGVNLFVPGDRRSRRRPGQVDDVVAAERQATGPPARRQEQPFVAVDAARVVRRPASVEVERHDLAAELEVDAEVG